jgi:hypothetical protein
MRTFEAFPSEVGTGSREGNARMGGAAKTGLIAVEGGLE